MCVCDEMKRPGQAAWLFSGKDMFLANAAPCRPSILVVVRSPSSVVRCPLSVFRSPALLLLLVVYTPLLICTTTLYPWACVFVCVWLCVYV